MSLKREKKLPKEFKKYFWDVNLDKLSFSQNYKLIFSRILSYGSIPAIHWLFKNSDKSSIKNYVLSFGGKQLDKRSNNLWRIFFGIKHDRKTP
ncbi:MAG: hypothetical protein FD145_274 [Candidatus Saganbacteria bacterium]|uniref:DUF6922 domain-containing protein n=1 Tax=Candidatus Saganbacteria bacterium TaxID=2575572 RepID=A0A833NXL9_UNCSA|nr:MAG: hypothetical protein FD145_274 [Candidatus Saganbacteria bacterium]